MGPPIIICKAEHDQISFWQYVLRSFLFEGSRPAGILMYQVLLRISFLVFAFKSSRNFLNYFFVFVVSVCLLQTWLNLKFSIAERVIFLLMECQNLEFNFTWTVVPT